MKIRKVPLAAKIDINPRETQNPYIPKKKKKRNDLFKHMLDAELDGIVKRSDNKEFNDINNSKNQEGKK